MKHDNDRNIIGQRWTLYADKKYQHILAQCDEKHLVLIDLECGNRWTNPVIVESLHTLTPIERDKLFHIPLEFPDFYWERD